MLSRHFLRTAIRSRGGGSPSPLMAVGGRNFASDVPDLPRVTERRPGETGRGGRGSDAGVKVAVFGATGFLGRYVCYNLGTNGTMTYIGNRGDEFTHSHLRPMFELGRARYVYYSSRDRQSMANVIADADVVISLVGKYYDTKALEDLNTFPFLRYKISTSVHEANCDVPRRIAEICKEMQVDNLIHVSSAAASPDSSSEWARAKYQGEQEVLEVYPWATIVRPTQMFGNEERLLLSWYANMAGRFPLVPLVDGGHALTQPVYVDDVARAINRIVDDPEKFEGRYVDCFGPQDYSYAELARFVYDITGQDPSLPEVPAEVVKYFARVMQYEGSPLLTPDMVDLMSEDYLPAMTTEGYESQLQQNKVFTMKDLAMESMPIEKIAFKYLHRFRKGGHFLLAKGYH